MFFLCCTFIIIATGCITTQSTSDNIIIRAEQAESGTKAAFDFVTASDDINRAFWKTNAPAFHNFAEWLRTPLTNNGVMYRRGLLMIKQVDDAKMLYKSNASQSNALLNVILDLEAAKSQASAWSTIVTSKTP